uniref:Uncharacterized protein n=1 Tax=Aegilops tauschii subsp. strangulata TaxID=200361 RepID=A0A453KJ40_AEGTS
MTSEMRNQHSFCLKSVGILSPRLTNAMCTFTQRERKKRSYYLV